MVKPFTKVSQQGKLTLKFLLKRGKAEQIVF